MRVFCLLLLFLPAFPALASMASAQTWVDVSPRDGRPVFDLVVDPSDPGRMVASTVHGVFVRDRPDGLWQSSSDSAGSFGDLLRQVPDLDVHPARPDVLFAATSSEVHKSTDGGASWRSLRSETQTVHGDLVRVAPADPDVVYAVQTLDGWFGRSDDGGETWRTPGSIREEIRFVAGVVLDPDDPLMVRMAGRAIDSLAPGLLVETRDGGATWRELPAEPLVAAAATSLVAGAAPNELLLGTFDGRFHRSRQSAGVRWTAIDGDLSLEPDTFVRDAAADARRPDRLLVAVGSGPATPDFVAIWRSDDDGVTWRRSDTGLPPGHRVARLVVSPHDADVVYAPGSHGIFESVDGGRRWARSDPGLPSLVSDLLVRPEAGGAPERLFATGGLSNLTRSDDQGRTWRSLPGEVPGLPADVEVRDIALGPSPSPAVYLLVRRGSERRLRFFRSDDGGDTWSELGEGLDGSSLLDFEVLPSSPPVLLASGEAGVYRSDDDGATWTRTSVDTRAGGVTVSRSDPSWAYVTVGSYYPPTGTEPWGVWSSDDAGLTWSLSRRGLPGLANIGPLVVDPDRPEIVLASTPRPVDGQRRPVPSLYRSTDGGETWSFWGSEMPGRDFRRLLHHPTEPSTLFAATTDGVSRSLDGGRTWR